MYPIDDKRNVQLDIMTLECPYSYCTQLHFVKTFLGSNQTFELFNYCNFMN